MPFACSYPAGRAEGLCAPLHILPSPKIGGQGVESSHGDNAEWNRGYGPLHSLRSTEANLRQTALSPFNTAAAQTQDRLTHPQPSMRTKDCVRRST
jgi:hypothetical protein